MAKKAHALFLAPVALLLATGATECDAWEDTTVPASDSTAPDVYDAVWYQGTYEEIDVHSQPLTYHLTPGEEIIALGSGLDSGGVKKISMTRELSWTCCTFGNVCSTSQTSATALTDTQAGGVGSTVSEGMWLGQAVEFDPAGLCNNFYWPTSYTFRWRTTAENYHGVKRVGPLRTVQWP